MLIQSLYDKKQRTNYELVCRLMVMRKDNAFFCISTGYAAITLTLS